MRYEIVPGTNNFELRMYNDAENKVAKIIFEHEADAREYGEDFLIGENLIDWDVQEDVGT